MDILMKIVIDKVMPYLKFCLSILDSDFSFLNILLLLQTIYKYI